MNLDNERIMKVHVAALGKIFNSLNTSEINVLDLNVHLLNVKCALNNTIG